MRDNDEIGFYFSLIKKKMDKHMNEGLKKYDLTKSQRDVLGYLHFTDKNPVIQKDIEKQIFIMESKFENALGIEKRKQLLEILKELAQNLE